MTKRDWKEPKKSAEEPVFIKKMKPEETQVSTGRISIAELEMLCWLSALENLKSKLKK